jgi:hypothetical protein
MVGSRVVHEEWEIEIDPEGVGGDSSGRDLHRIGYTPVEPDPDGRTPPFWTEGLSNDELKALYAALGAYLELEVKRWGR